jgi:thymidylate synthase
MRAYLDALSDILERGTDRPSRPGVDTRALFGMQLEFDLRDGYPAVTTKELAFSSMRAENVWFLTGSRDVNDLERMGSSIWRENAEAEYWKPKAEFPGDVGRIYGVQWRRWRAPDGEEVDQVARVLRGLEEEPHGRRHVITGWNPGELDEMALPPCHLLYQYHVDAEGGLHLSMYQRSADMFLGVPFNIASCGLYLAMFAQASGLEARTLTISLGDAHVYHDHFQQVEEQLSREPLDPPELSLSPAIDAEWLIGLKGEDSLTEEELDRLIALEDYEHHPRIPAPMAV